MPCLMVHANSHGSIDNVPCGTSITCFLSYSLETLEQQHHEYVKVSIHYNFKDAVCNYDMYMV